MARLTISDRRERALVAAADALLRAAARPRPRPAPVSRILAFRLERIGDLLMALPAIAMLKDAFPGAALDLAVGSWNAEIAAAIPGVDRVETLDAAWLSRGAAGRGPLGLLRAAARWRPRRYDVAFNFEPDIRSNLALRAAGARWTAGFSSGGGGPLLDLAIDYDATIHTTDNACALVEAAAAVPVRPAAPGLTIPDAHRDRAARLLAPFDGRVTVGIHVSAGREVKQWPEARFRDVADHLVRTRGAAVVLTGSSEDRAQIDGVRRALPADRVLDLSGDTGLLTLAAVLERLALFVTGDTGPMHLAHAVRTPIVAIFGPSDPRRYGPRGPRNAVVRVDLPCSPCNRIRNPPERCAGHTPACLAGVDTRRVLDAIDDVLDGR